MPELPEVETVRLQLLHKIKVKEIETIKVYNPKSAGNNVNFAKKLQQKKFSHIDRIGKLLIFSFLNEPDLFLLAHLRMTGQFFYTDKTNITGGGHTLTKSDTAKFPGKHTRVAFYFTDQTALFFNDMRMFGYIKLATKLEMEEARAKFGQEPTKEDFDTAAFIAKLKRKKTSIKATLLDQTFIAGLGNIYVDEALFAAKVRPTRQADSITKHEAETIARVSGEIMNKAIAHGGTTFQHFADTEDASGNFSAYLQVFGKQKEPCPNCGTTIEKIRVAGRGTHYCPTCQK